MGSIRLSNYRILLGTIFLKPRTQNQNFWKKSILNPQLLCHASSDFKMDSSVRLALKRCFIASVNNNKLSLLKKLFYKTKKPSWPLIWRFSPFLFISNTVGPKIFGHKITRRFSLRTILFENRFFIRFYVLFIRNSALLTLPVCFYHKTLFYYQSCFF